jgi:exodeoxyribonuclease V
MELSQDQWDAQVAIGEWLRGVPRSVYCTDAGCPGPKDSDGEAYAHTHGHAVDWPVFSLTGLAGTGKTRLVGTLWQSLGLRIAYGAPTHKAVGVLRRKLEAMSVPVGSGDERDVDEESWDRDDEAIEQGDRVRTYHSLLFYNLIKYKCKITGRYVKEIKGCNCRLSRRQEECECPQRFTLCVEGGHGSDCHIEKELDQKLRENIGGFRDLIVLDEASMIPEKKVEEIRQLNLPILLAGDFGQLPPVKEKMNPWMLRPSAVLTTNHRQSEANGVVAAALQVRELGSMPYGTHGDGSTVVVSAREHPEALQVISPERMPPGPDSVIIVPFHRLRAAINRSFHGDGELPHVGDRVISLETKRDPNMERIRQREDGTWHPEGAPVPVYNSMMGVVRAVNPSNRILEKTVELVVELDDEEDTCVTFLAAINQFGAENTIPYNKKPRDAHLWDYAYALTCHKAQGSEYERVLVLDNGALDWKRWMYTAMTRAKSKLIVIDWRN